MKSRNTLLALIFIFSVVSCSNSVLKIYVAPDGDNNNQGTKSQPLLTPSAAKQKAIGLISENPEKDIHIIFREGTYELKESLEFNHTDGGSDSQQVIYEAYKDERVVFSGGKEISEWSVRDDGLWEAEIDGDHQIEQLYINGIRATRARIPNTDADLSRWFIDSVQVTVNQEDGLFERMLLKLKDDNALLNLPLIGESEIVIFKDWATLRKQVSGINSETGMLELKPPLVFFDGNYNGLLAPYSNRFSCFLEGNKAFIDQPGEWAYDSENKTLLYSPLSGLEIEATIAVIPVQKTLIHLMGSRDKPIKNLHFNNIKFHYAAYVLPDFGHDGRQACFYYSKGTGIPLDKALIEEAVRIEWARNCSFTSCDIAHTGANGIYITMGSNNINVAECRLYDIGGNGLMIGTAFDPEEDTAALVNRILISDCKLWRAGQHYQSAVGIWQGFAAYCNISGNEVYDLPYTGISIGWQWNPIPTSSQKNIIADNHIYDVMKMLGDGGGIYTLGYQPGSVIRDNKIHDIMRSELNHASPNNGMFIDEGSKGYLVEGNHIYNVSHTCIRGHRAAGVELRGNIFEPGEFPAISHTPPYGAMIFANNDTTISWPNPGWPTEWGYPDTIVAFTMMGNSFGEMTGDK